MARRVPRTFARADFSLRQICDTALSPKHRTEMASTPNALTPAPVSPDMERDHLALEDGELTPLELARELYGGLSDNWEGDRARVVAACRVCPQLLENEEVRCVAKQKVK